MLPNIYPGLAVRNTRCRLVVSPRGTLSAFSLGCSRWLKRLMMVAGQRRVLETAACLHATAAHEYEDIRRVGLRAPVAIIPNGVDVPAGDLSKKTSKGGRRRLLFLGRVHPEKNVDHLLHAWRAVQDAFPDWELRIVGPASREYALEMQTLSERLGCRRITYLPAVYGGAKSCEFLEADLFVLPSPSENFGMAVAEALVHGLPAIVTKGAPWGGLQSEGCGWWIDVGTGPLVKCLRDAMSSSPAERDAMGRRGREWMQRAFSWAEVGRKMLSTYEWLVGGGAAPEWVRQD
jgi:glycosyltransferase involved in cell wall biosynthesis